MDVTQCNFRIAPISFVERIEMSVLPTIVPESELCFRRQLPQAAFASPLHLKEIFTRKEITWTNGNSRNVYAKTLTRCVRAGILSGTTRIIPATIA